MSLPSASALWIPARAALPDPMPPGWRTNPASRRGRFRTGGKADSGDALAAGSRERRRVMNPADRPVTMTTACSTYTLNVEEKTRRICCNNCLLYSVEYVVQYDRRRYELDFVQYYRRETAPSRWPCAWPPVGSRPAWDLFDMPYTRL